MAVAKVAEQKSAIEETKAQSEQAAEEVKASLVEATRLAADRQKDNDALRREIAAGQKADASLAASLEMLKAALAGRWTYLYTRQRPCLYTVIHHADTHACTQVCTNLCTNVCVA